MSTLEVEIQQNVQQKVLNMRNTSPAQQNEL